MKKDGGNARAISRLYAHALESIFGFLSLKDLGAATRTSRSWSAAVQSMRGISASLKSLPKLIASSRLARHIGTLGSQNKPIRFRSNEQMSSVGLYMSGLRTLHYEMSPWVPNFPPSLTHLDVVPRNEGAEYSEDEQTSIIVRAASRIPNLVTLYLPDSIMSDAMSFAPLYRSEKLITLGLGVTIGSCLSQKQADELRAIPNLTRLDMSLGALDVSRLFYAPHRLQWTGLDFSGHLDTNSIALLASLPDLVRLYMHGNDNLFFLRSLPRLVRVTLSAFSPRRDQHLFAEIGQCTQLTNLDIWNSSLTSSELTELLVHLPALLKLHLFSMANLESLSFLSSNPTHKLTHLTLGRCKHPQLRAKEMRHICSLQQLVYLHIKDCFSEKLDSFTLSEFEVPSARLPNLVFSELQS